MSATIHRLRPEPEPGPRPAPASPREAAERVRLPPPEMRPAPQRGPFRPGELTPARTRLLGQAVSAGVRAADIASVALFAAIAAGSAPILPLLVGAALLVVGLSVAGAYRFAPYEGVGLHLMRVATAFGLTTAALGVYAVAGEMSVAMIEALSLWLCQGFAALYFIHAASWLAVRRWRRKGLLTPNLVIVGATPGAVRLIEQALRSGEVAVLGVFDDRRDRIGPEVRGVPVLGDTAALLTHRIMPCVDRVVITVAPSARTRVASLVDRLSVLPNPVSLLLDDGAGGRDEGLSRMAGLTLANMSGRSNDANRALVKRLQDLVIGGLGLLAVAPVMLLTALAVKLDSPGPVFFRQKRHGFNNEEILVWKFRSMRQDAADATASRQVRVDDDRVTRVGRFIRRTSLDELPQLFNVLKGEMSLVGPRPHAVGMKTGDTESAKLVAHYAHRHRMKPGLTGWAAIKGSRGPVDTPDLVRRRVALDVEYIERQSFWFDFYIILMTIPCLLGDGDAVR